MPILCLMLAPNLNGFLSLFRKVYFCAKQKLKESAASVKNLSDIPPYKKKTWAHKVLYVRVADTSFGVSRKLR